MRSPAEHPIVLALPLDHGATDVLDAAEAVARRLGAAVLPVHALASIASERARDTLATWLEPLRARGIEVLEPTCERARTEQLVTAVAARVGAPLTIVGSGRGSTIRDWLLGTTAERIVRASAAPVWIARGTLPGPTSPVLVPVDLGEETRLAIVAGGRWARLFGASLRVLHVLPAIEPGSAEETTRAIDELRADASAKLQAVLAGIDLDVPVEVRFAHGPIGASLVREAEDAGLVVVAQRDYEALVPASLGSRLERLVRTSRASVLAVRDDDVARQRAVREERAAWVATLRTEAEAALAAGDPARAERLLSNAKIAAPASARIEDALAVAIEAQGRAEEADRHRALARWIRADLA